MRALVFLEHHDGALTRGSSGVLSQAASFVGGPVTAVLAGRDVAGLVKEAARFGAGTVLLADDPALDPPLPQARVDLLEHIVHEHSFDTVLFAGSVLAADVAAGLAARMNAGLNWDLVDIALTDGGLVGTRPVLRDSLQAAVGWRSELRLAIFRPGVFEPLAREGVEVSVKEIRTSFSAHSTIARVVERESEKSEGPSIEDADIVVAGGRGLGGPEQFRLAEEVARALGGAVGATRAVVDAGWYPYAAQIGQTGKTVAPKLYVALGISGAIQHKVGMQGSDLIVSINKDPNAPIFEFSDLSVVADVSEVVPRLIELISARGAQS